MPDWIAVILLGIIEGVTEFIPISSTGHLLLAQRWLPRQSDLFNIVIQSAAVLAVLPLFSGRLKKFICCPREPQTRDYLLKLAVAFGLTGIGGLVLESRNFKLPETAMPVALALVIGGILFIVIERWLEGKKLQPEVTWAIAIAVGIGQLLAAVFPGISRSGATILVALLMGLSRPAAVEFSFLVGIPTILAAGGLKIFKHLAQSPDGAVAENWGLLALGTVVSAIVSFIAVKWLLRFIQANTFAGFGWYRIGLGVLVLVFFAA